MSTTVALASINAVEAVAAVSPAPAGAALATDTTVAAAPVAAPLEYRVDGNAAYFKMGEHPLSGAAFEISVLIDDGNLVFFPERSAAHRDLMDALGLSLHGRTEAPRAR